MKKNKGYLVMLVLMIMLTGIAVPAHSEDSTANRYNCISSGIDSFGLARFEYEREILNHLTLFADYRFNLFEGISGYSYGMNYYFEDNPLNGFYLGLSQSHIHDENIDLLADLFRYILGRLFGWPLTPSEPSDYVLTSETFGYQFVFKSNLTLDLAMVYSQSPSANTGVLYYTVGFGLRW